MFIDFFTYTTATPGGELSAEELVAAAKEAGLDGICVADHEASYHADELLEAAEEAGFFVAIGVELDVQGGTLTCLPPSVDSFLLEEEWRQLTTFGQPLAQEVIDLVVGLGGAVFARNVWQRQGAAMGDGVFRLKGLSGLDALSPKRMRIDNELAMEAALNMGLPALAGSDTKADSKDLGAVATLLGKKVSTQEELVAQLRRRAAWPVVMRNLEGRAPTGGNRSRDDDRGGRSDERRGGRGRDGDRRGGRGDRDRGGRGDDRRGGRGRDGDRRGGRGGGRGRRGEGEGDRGRDRSRGDRSDKPAE